MRKAAFGSLEKLKNLDLSNNPIQKIKLSCLVSLEYLVMECCKVSQVNQETFSGLTNLTHLDLKANPFGMIDPNMFKNMKNLKQVIMNRMCLNIFKIRQN